MKALKENWYVVFLIAAFAFALFPPTTIVDGGGGKVLFSQGFGEIHGHETLSPVFGDAPMFSQRDWQAWIALEVPCLLAFAVFGLRKPNPNYPIPKEG